MTHVINENIMSIEMCVLHGIMAVVVHAHTNKFEVVVEGIVVSYRKSNQYSIHLMQSQKI